MTARSPSVLRSALSLMSIRLVLEQMGLALLVFLLYVLWLRIPDASVLDVIGSAVLALLILAVAGAGESSLMLRTAGRARTLSGLLRGTLFLLAGVALWFAWSALMGHFRGDYNQNDGTLAGYLNARLPHAFRYVFTYERILSCIVWGWELLGGIVAGVIAAFIFSWIAALRPIRAVAILLRSVGYWCVVVLVSASTTLLTTLLLQWTPGHGLRVEMASMALRLSIAVLGDTAAACLLLTTLAVFTRRADALDVLHATPAGTPDESQPRTADNP
jgi:hypothetical protein